MLAKSDNKILKNIFIWNLTHILHSTYNGYEFRPIIALFNQVMKLNSYIKTDKKSFRIVDHEN